MKVNHFMSKVSFSILLAWSGFATANDICFNNSCCQTADYKFDVSASYLYWGVQEDPLGFGIENINLSNDNISTGTGKIKTHKPKWDSGVRVEAGMSSSCIPFGCHFEWTNFQTHSNASAFSNIPGIPSVAVTTISSSPNSNGNPFFSADTAHSKWDFNINEYALDFDYMGWCGSCVSFKPYVGVYGAVIKQKQTVAYKGVSIQNTSSDITVERKNHFWGVGPRIGVELNWNIYNKLNLITNTSAAYLVGEFDIKNHLTIPPELTNRFVDINENVHRARPMTSGLIGLQWNEQVNCNFTVSLSVSYEFQYWWQQWHSSSSMLQDLLTGEGQSGDLALHGLVVTGGVSF